MSATDTQKSPTSEAEVLSFRAVRQALGLLGFALPVALVIAGLWKGTGIQPSISDTFNTTQREIFVGTMCAIGVFLYAYRGYPRQPAERLSDRWLSKIAGLSAICVAFFPVSPAGQKCSQTVDYVTLMQQIFRPCLTEKIHYASAFVFFVCLILLCYQFTKTRDEKARAHYVWCMFVLIAITCLMVVVFLLNRSAPSLAETIKDFDIIFYLESIGVWAFAWAWLKKGKTIETLRAAIPFGKN